MLAQTPSQTVGPFFAHALTPADPEPKCVADNWLAEESTLGTPIRIEGRMLDGAAGPVPDGMIEIWQADHRGAFADGLAGFRGFGRAGTDAAGRYAFLTIKPGSIAPGHAPHVSVAVFARGMLNHAYTRIYFSDEEGANAADPVLMAVDAERRATLVATRRAGDGALTYDFTIRLQGEGETVFFDA